MISDSLRNPGLHKGSHPHWLLWSSGKKTAVQQYRRQARSYHTIYLQTIWAMLLLGLQCSVNHEGQR